MPSLFNPKHETMVRQSTPAMRVFRYQSTNIIDGQDYGVVGDGVADDTVGIQNALDDARAWDNVAPRDADHPVDTYGGSNCVRLVGVFKITNTITIGSHFDGSRATFLVYNNPAFGVKVELPSQAIFDRRTVHLPEMINMTIATPATAIGTAVQVQNAQNCKIHFRKIEGWNRAVYLVGNVDGFAWNQVHLEQMLNNKVCCELGIQNGGYCNENQFFGGNFALSSGSNLAGHYYLKIGDGSQASINNNVFHQPALEGDAPQYHVYSSGRFIQILNPRLETSSLLPRMTFDGTNASMGSDHLVWMGCQTLVAGQPPIDITNIGTAARNNVVTFQTGAGGGLSYYGPVAFDRKSGDVSRATLKIDDTNHRVGLGGTSNTEQVGIKSFNSKGVNLAFDDWAYIGETYSQQGLILGYNAKADIVNTVGDQVVAGNSYGSGYYMMRMSTAENGIGMYARSGAVTQGDILPKASTELIFKVTPTGPQINTLPGFTAGARYLILDGSGNIRLSAIGPAS